MLCNTVIINFPHGGLFYLFSYWLFQYPGPVMPEGPSDCILGITAAILVLAQATDIIATSVTVNIAAILDIASIAATLGII